MKRLYCCHASYRINLNCFSNKEKVKSYNCENGLDKKILFERKFLSNLI